MGEPGSGKTELIKYLASEINRGNVPGCEGWRVFSTTCTAIIEGTKYVGMMQEKIGRMFRYFESRLQEEEKVVVFIDEIHQAVSTGKSMSSDATSIAEALLTYMANPNIRVIAATTHENSAKLDQNPPFRDRFEKVTMPRMTPTRRQKILEFHLGEIQTQFPDLTLPENFFERVQLANSLKGEKSLRRDIGLLYATAANMDRTKRPADAVLEEDLLEYIEGYIAILDSKGFTISEEFEEKLVRAKEQLGLGFGGESQIFAKVISQIPRNIFEQPLDLDAVLEQVVQHWSR
ncbi:MAG: AAA family ATPase [Chlamydiales bacterium]|nr:AAA family ATPase [Chlamydiales bacterium]